MLENDLYSIGNIVTSGDGLIAEIRINPLHQVFEGHFPGYPVTPGVVQMEFVKAAMQLHLNREISLKTMRTCKFLEVLDPNITPVIHVVIKYKEADDLEVVASGEFSGITFFKIQATYR